MLFFVQDFLSSFSILGGPGGKWYFTRWFEATKNTQFCILLVMRNYAVSSRSSQYVFEVLSKALVGPLDIAIDLEDRLAQMLHDHAAVLTKHKSVSSQVRLYESCLQLGGLYMSSKTFSVWPPQQARGRNKLLFSWELEAGRQKGVWGLVSWWFRVNAPAVARPICYQSSSPQRHWWRQGMGKLYCSTHVLSPAKMTKSVTLPHSVTLML